MKKNNMQDYQCNEQPMRKHVTWHMRAMSIQYMNTAVPKAHLLNSDEPPSLCISSFREGHDTDR